MFFADVSKVTFKQYTVMTFHGTSMDDMTAEECQTVCTQMPGCVAVDFVTQANKCYTYMDCDNATRTVVDVNVNHYTKVCASRSYYIYLHVSQPCLIFQLSQLTKWQLSGRNIIVSEYYFYIAAKTCHALKCVSC